MVKYKIWVCLNCGKEWQIPADIAYPSLICDCNSTDLIPKILADKLPSV